MSLQGWGTPLFLQLNSGPVLEESPILSAKMAFRSKAGGWAGPLDNLKDFSTEFPPPLASTLENGQRENEET